MTVRSALTTEQLIAAVASLQSEIAHLSGAVNALDAKVGELTALRNKGAGILIGVSLVFSIFGAAVSALLSWFKG